jgi:hypothetical protein
MTRRVSLFQVIFSREKEHEGDTGRGADDRRVLWTTTGLLSARFLEDLVHLSLSHEV